MAQVNIAHAALVVALRDGNADALGRCYHAHASTMLAVATQLLGNRLDAEDVVHDVFVGLPEAVRRYDERGSFDAWLKRVTIRQALMYERSVRNRHESDDDIEMIAAPSLEVTMAGEQRDMEQALASLTPTLRHVFVLRCVEGYSHAEIATLLGISVAASEVRLCRALDRLRAKLGRHA